MGKIDKEKLIEDLPCSDGNGCRGTKCQHNVAGESLTQCINKVIKSFPEETVKKAELPVKTIYKIKPEYEAIFLDIGYDKYVSECHDHIPENIKNVGKYYYKITLVDYSAITKINVL